MEIILASASPRRREILDKMGYSFRIVSADIDESTDAETASEAVLITAKRKAEAVSGTEKGLIIAADTVVEADGQILGKPESKEDAERMLSHLSGKRHTVHTGVCVTDGKKTAVFEEKTDVFFRQLTKEEIDEYISTGEPLDKAGAYGIQGKGALLIKKINGDYFNAVGLPVSKLYTVLRNEFGMKGIGGCE